MSSLKIKIKTKTWNKDSYGLFDYENDDVNKQTLTVTSQGVLTRDQDQVKFEAQKHDFLSNSYGENYLMSIFHKDGASYLFNQTSQKVWSTLSGKLGGSKDSTNIKEGDVFKLGKIMFEVLKIKNYEEKKKGNYYDSVLNSLKQYYKDETHELIKKNTFDTEAATLLQDHKLIVDDKEPNKRLCRFCLSDSIVEENPLLNLCKCDGSLKYVHLICLQNWLTNKLHLKKTDGILTVLWQGLSCELCKSQLPLMIECDGQTYDLIDFKSFYEENVPAAVKCMVLQSFTKNNKPSGLHFIDLAMKNTIRIGRGNECEIRLSDISVSRLHSSIRMENNKFILKDNSSKFGTLFLNRKNICIGQNHLFIQCGRTLVEIYSSKKWYSNFPCISCEANVNGRRFEEEEEKKK